MKDTILDLGKISNKKGVYHLTLQNNGETIVVLDDATQQEIAPGEMFVIESPVAIINHNFSIAFNSQKGKSNSLIVSYVVALEEC